MMAANNGGGEGRKSKGTKVNPDETNINPVDQLDQITKKKKLADKNKTGDIIIDTVGKSMQNVKNTFKDLTNYDIDDLLQLDW